MNEEEICFLVIDESVRALVTVSSAVPRNREIKKKSEDVIVTTHQELGLTASYFLNDFLPAFPGYFYFSFL